MKRLRKPLLFGAGSFAGLVMSISPQIGAALFAFVLLVGLLTEPVV